MNGRKGMVLAAVAATVFSLEVFAAPRAATPDSTPNHWFPKRHGEIVEKAKAGGAKVVFVGDSITHFWERGGAEQMKKYFSQGDMKMLNLGIMADRTEHVLWRVGEGGELDGYEAKFVSLMIGTNNAGQRHEKPEETAAGVKAILDVIRAKQPNAVVVLTAIFPRGASDEDRDRKLNEQTNKLIEKYADEKKVFWLDFNDRLVDYKGDTRFIMNDRLHPTAAGYEIWYDELKPYVDYAFGKGAKPASRVRYGKKFQETPCPVCGACRGKANKR